MMLCQCQPIRVIVGLGHIFGMAAWGQNHELVEVVIFVIGNVAEGAPLDLGYQPLSSERLPSEPDERMHGLRYSHAMVKDPCFVQCDYLLVRGKLLPELIFGFFGEYD